MLRVEIVCNGCFPELWARASRWLQPWLRLRSSRLPNRHQRQANRVIGARQDRRPMRRMDKFPRPIVRRRTKTRIPIKVRPNTLARPQARTRTRTRTSPRPRLQQPAQG
jgi:hypothetical protein